MWVVYFVTIVTFFLFLPLKINLLVYFDGQNKRLWISFYLYDFIKLFGGRLENKKGKVILRFSKSKYKIIDIKDMGKMRIKPQNFKGIEVVSSRLITSLRPSAESLGLGYFITVVNDFIHVNLSRNKDFVDLKSTVILGRDDKLKVYYKMVFMINILVILCGIFRGIVLNEK